ncbi:Thiamine biosynthesis lipoprotein ApbE precursor [Lignipirellula cremea]|uniref:FAD:protein FMN transferase n=2 Tax=Lignipirellula cremea TaxID=2528010 RepID=A0A518DYA5_9BACT|nr:Thiamine biosynthesis lipoprotein ApbE precursor [Lignipirellula cremea]
MLLIGSAADAGEFAFYDENVLGSSWEFRCSAPTEENARQAGQTALQEIERLRAVLSTWDQTSEISRWLKTPGAAVSVSPDLWNVLHQADQWEKTSGGAFNPRVASAARLWAAAAKAGRPPGEEPLAQAAAELSQPAWRLGPAGQAERQGEAPVSIDGLAKGYILDCVCRRLRERHSEVTSFVVNLGGDLRTIGTPQTISIADPLTPAENGRPVSRFLLPANQAVATSGGYRRFWEIQGQRYSHLIDPRTARPAAQVQSATVTAATAADADAAATILGVLDPAAGLKLIASLPDMECLIVDQQGRLHRSSGWADRERQAPQPLHLTALADAAPQRQLLIQFTLKKPDTFRYRRPYLAIWLENSEGFPVKTALLWMMTDVPGPRWHRELTRWYRNDRIRKEAEGSELIGVITGATRGPGDYQAVFDGTDNKGKPLAAGEYLLCIEIAREHGDYKLLRKRVELGNGPLEPYTFRENPEIEASFTYDFPPAREE